MVIRSRLSHGIRIAYSFALIAPLLRRKSPRYATPCRSANAILRHSRAMFSYRLLLFISCYCIARHSINGLRKLGNARHGRRLVLLRLATATATARQGKAPATPRTTQDKPHPIPSPPHGERGRQAASHPTPPVVGGGGLGTAPQGKKTT
jgi:hypothetical protein